MINLEEMAHRQLSLVRAEHERDTVVQTALQVVVERGQVQDVNHVRARRAVETLYVKVGIGHQAGLIVELWGGEGNLFFAFVFCFCHILILLTRQRGEEEQHGGCDLPPQLHHGVDVDLDVAQEDGGDGALEEEQREEGEEQENGDNNLPVALQDVGDVSKAPGDASLGHDHPVDVVGHEFVELFLLQVELQSVATEDVQVVLIFPQHVCLGQVLVVQVHL